IMKTLRSILIGAALLTVAVPALAIDTSRPTDLPDLEPIRVKIKAKDFKSAAADLNALVDRGVQDPDVYNLLGFILRNLRDRKTAMTFYQKALEFDPNHKSALEYQGELFVQIGDIGKARDNAVKLTKLCPQGCEELEDLEQAIAKASKTN